MKKNFCLIIITVVMIGFYACSGTGKNASANSSSLNTNSKKQAIDTADTRLANDLSVFCATQVNAAKLAQTKASTQKVKEYAKQNGQLYTQLNNYLNNLSEEYNLKLPAELTSASRKNFEGLKAIKTASFGHAYLLQILKQHNAAIREINAAKNIQCIPLKMFVGSNQAAIIKQAYAISDLKDKTP